MRLTQADNKNRKPLFEMYIGILVMIIVLSLETHTFTTYVMYTCYNTCTLFPADEKKSYRVERRTVRVKCVAQEHNTVM